MRQTLESLTAKLLARFNRTQVFLIMLCLTGIMILSFLQIVFDQISIFMGVKWSPLMLVNLAFWAVSYIAMALVGKEFKRRYPNPRQTADE